MYCAEEDLFVKCPFDATHVLKSFRLPRHIVKCKENHPEMKLKRCPFNWTHLLNDEDFDEHLKVCYDKSQTENSRDVIKFSKGISVSHTGSECDGDDDFSGFACKPLKSRVGESAEKEVNHDYGWVYYDKDFDGRKINGTLLTKDETKGNDLGDEELLPLPLPKTTSKAFKIKKI